jgi:hypothetical protein
MEYLFALLLIAAGLLGASALIVAKKPNAASVINALVPFQARLGAGQQRAAEVAAKIAPWQLLIGCVAAVSGVLIILFRSGILPPTFPNGIF